MSLTEVIEEVRNENSGHPSLEDQVRALIILDEEAAYDEDNALKRSELKELAEERGIEFDHTLKTVLDNLCATVIDDEFHVLENFFPPGPDTFVISEREDAIVNGEFEETVEHEREALIDHIQDDDPVEDEGDSPAIADGSRVTVRSVVAEALGIVADGVEAHLRAGDLGDQADRVNTAIDAIEEHDEVEKRDEYGKITYRHVAYRYRFTDGAVARIEA